MGALELASLELEIMLDELLLLLLIGCELELIATLTLEAATELIALELLAGVVPPLQALNATALNTKALGLSMRSNG